MSKKSDKTPLNLTRQQHLFPRAPIFTPSSTPSDTPLRSSSRTRSISARNTLTMETAPAEQQADHVETQLEQQSSSKPETKSQDDLKASTPKANKKNHKSKHSRPPKSKHSKRERKCESSSDSSSSDEDEDESDQDSSSSSESSSSEDERKVRRKARKRKVLKKRQKDKKKGKGKRRTVHTSDSSSDESDISDSESSSSSNEGRRPKRGKARRKPNKYSSGLDENPSDFDDDIDGNARLQAQLAAMQLNRRVVGQNRVARPTWLDTANDKQRLDRHDRLDGRSKKKRKPVKRASTLEYKRVDQLWDTTIHNYKITESAKDKEDEFEQYVFTVRRKFDWENKYKNTVVDIKSKVLKEALQEVMKDVKGVSLVEDQPSIDPNMLFLYLEELRDHAKTSLKSKVKSEKKRKLKKRYKLMISHVKVLVNYLDQDYEETKKTLYPMLEAGNITFDLLWALFKPNSIAYTTTYGSSEHPRCFKVDYATKESSFMRGEWYCIEGRYLEYDGKSFGLGDFEADVESFKGPRKITSLAAYPLTYHKDPEGLSKRLIERGRRFVSLEGMNYCFHNGLAFMKKKKTVAKVNIHGRIMIDPAIFRRINPNYPISFIKPKDPDEMSNGGACDDDSSDCGCGNSEDEDQQAGEGPNLGAKEPRERTRTKVIVDKDGQHQLVQVAIDDDGMEIQVETIDKLPEDIDPGRKREYTNEELLIASPVVLGFAFSEKLWLEFSLSGVKDIEWNEGAFESLVLPTNQKTIVRALVESHKFHAAKTIDDVVQGKGKGLVAVLHGSPGTGKTLTAEGIAELLKCPLYMVSAGELGTDPRLLEQELQKILDIAHSWGAVLLLDEADVFLEKRQIHDIHRNALVSIFLRLLEYFQGILFLTTNRVETFDDAFQSRIHVALRYGELTSKAKRAVWKMFLEKVRAMEGADTEAFKDAELDILARNNLNGRQIKNAVRTAQALAVNEGQKLSMEHIKRVLEVAESFEQDLKGGSGYKDAMRSYT